jgi:hypothetical protein
VQIKHFEARKAGAWRPLPSVLGGILIPTAHSKIPEQMIDEIIEKDAAVAKLRAAISKTKADLARARKNVQNEDDPDVRRLEDQLDLHKQSLDVLKEARLQAFGAVRKKLEQTAEHDADLAKDKLEYLTQYKEVLDVEVKRFDRESRDLNQGNLNLDDDREREYERVAKLADLIASKKEELKIEIEAPTRVRRLDDARIERIETPTHLKILSVGLAALAGLLALFVIAFAGFRHRRPNSPETESSSWEPPPPA